MDPPAARRDVPAWSCLQETRQSNWHTSAACLCGQALVIFGGTGRDEPAEVYVYHLHELKWLRGSPTGRGPVMRPLYCSAAGRGDSVAVVWSSMSARGAVEVTLSVLSLSEMAWHSVPLGTAGGPRTPPPRRGYRALMTCDGDVVVFGGEHNVHTPTPTATCTVVAPDATVVALPPEACPPPRSDHASCVAPHDTLVVHGGKGAHGTLLGDMHVYDARRRTWVGVGDGPGRCGHSIAATDTMILLFGGVDAEGLVRNDLWRWSVATHEWSGPLLTVGSRVPGHRAGHLFALVWPMLDAEPLPPADSEGDASACFILYGGVEGPGEPPFHDIHRLTVPADRELPLAVALSGKLRPAENPIDAHPPPHPHRAAWADDAYAVDPDTAAADGRSGFGNHTYPHPQYAPGGGDGPHRPLGSPPPSQLSGFHGGGGGGMGGSDGFDDDDDILGLPSADAAIDAALDRLRAAADDLDQQERDLAAADRERRDRARRLQQERALLEREKAALLGQVYNAEMAGMGAAGALVAVDASLSSAPTSVDGGLGYAGNGFQPHPAAHATSDTAQQQQHHHQLSRASRPHASAFAPGSAPPALPHPQPSTHHAVASHASSRYAPPPPATAATVAAGASFAGLSLQRQAAPPQYTSMHAAELAGARHAPAGGVVSAGWPAAAPPPAPPPGPHHVEDLERQLQEERQKVSLLVARLSEREGAAPSGPATAAAAAAAANISTAQPVPNATATPQAAAVGGTLQSTSPHALGAATPRDFTPSGLGGVHGSGGPPGAAAPTQSLVSPIRSTQQPQQVAAHGSLHLPLAGGRGRGHAGPQPQLQPQPHMQSPLSTPSRRITPPYPNTRFPPASVSLRPPAAAAAHAPPCVYPTPRVAPSSALASSPYPGGGRIFQ